MRKLLRHARQAARGQGPVLLRGEEEVGKAQLAEAIHFGSERAAGPLVIFNCQAWPRERMALELMGSDEAGQERAGKFELAHGGTLVLEQVECLPLRVRIIATSSAPLEQRVQEGEFGRQLLYALQGCELWLPSLRERRADLPGLIRQHLTVQGASRGASSPLTPSTACWPTPGPATWGSCAAPSSTPSFIAVRHRSRPGRSRPPSARAIACWWTRWWGSRGSPWRSWSIRRSCGPPVPAMARSARWRASSGSAAPPSVGGSNCSTSIPPTTTTDQNAPQKSGPRRDGARMGECFSRRSDPAPVAGSSSAPPRHPPLAPAG